MSEGMNKVLLVGNLGADPELRYTTAGAAVLSIRVATNERYVDRNKEVQERTEWHTCVVWGNRAEALSRLLSKGQAVLVEGGLRTSSYEKDGVKRYKTEINVREIIILGRRPNGGANGVASDVAAGALFVPAPKPTDMLDELPY